MHLQLKSTAGSATQLKLKDQLTSRHQNQNLTSVPISVLKLTNSLVLVRP